MPSIACRSILAICLLMAPVIAPCASAQAGGAAPAGAATTPPSVRTGLRLPEIQLHDPWILADRMSRTYYLYSAASPRITGQGRTGTLYYTSKDLVSWEGPRIAFVVPESSWADPRVGAWAPEVHEYDTAQPEGAADDDGHDAPEHLARDGDRRERLAGRSVHADEA